MSAEDSEFGRHENGNIDEHGLSRTRSRVSRACTRCRSRKDKCDGARPSCAACLSSSQPCSYEPSTKKRGLPEGYVRGLEKLWAVLVSKIDGLADTVAEILEEHRDTLLQAWNHRQTGEELHSMWKDSRVLQELETLLSALENVPVHGTKRKRDKDEDDAALEEASPDLQLVLSVAYNVQMQEGTNRVASGHPVRTHPAKSLTLPDSVLLPPIASKIIGQYFKFTHCWMPVLDKPRILRRCYEFSRTNTSVGQSNADLAVLAAALAYATQYSGRASHSFASSGPIAGLRLLQLSRRCIPSAEGIYELGHIQALLILALNDIGNGLWEPAWRSVGLAVRAMQGIRNVPQLPPRDHAATQQMCLILDTALALRLGRTPYLSGREILALGLLNEDGHEEWEPWVDHDRASSYASEPSFTISCFNRLTKVFAILNTHIRDHTAPSPEAADESSRALDHLAGEDPYPLHDSSLRPPHQSWMKVALLLASAYVEAPHSGQTSRVTKSLDAVSEILRERADVFAGGLAAMPTLIFALLHATCDALLANKTLSTSLPKSSGLGLIADRLDDVSKHWLDARETANKVREYLTRFEEPLENSPSVSAKRRRGPTLPLDPTQSQHRSLNLWPSDPFTQTFANKPQPSATVPTGRNGSVRTRASTQPFATNIPIPLEASGPVNDGVNAMFPFGPVSSMDLRNMSIDDTTGVHDGVQHNPSIATSPSFQGDEIDALFREMAQLDTTEWTSGRSQALKDFGFYDDTTFEAFCNDPDRLYNSPNNLNNQQMNAFSGGNTLTFDPGFVNQPLGSGLNNFDMVGTTWNG